MKKTLLIVTAIMTFGQIIAQNNAVWQKVNRLETAKLTKVRTDINEETVQYFTLDIATFKQALLNSKDKFSNQQGVIIEFPNRKGELESFYVWENSNMEPDFQALFPEIRAYVGKGITDKSAVVNFSVSPQGVQTILFRNDAPAEFIEAVDAQATVYVLFDSYGRGKSTLKCTTIDQSLDFQDFSLNNTFSRANNQKYKTMRLALSCTAEYSNAFGATSASQSALVVAKMNATMTRVNGVYEKDIAVHLNMINNLSIIYYNASTDPYSPAASMNNWNAELQANLTSVITAANYDIGHLFGASGGGGNAGCIGCVCSASTKGSGITSPGSGLPTGDSFDIDYVAHEMGHQLGANHTFTYGGISNVSSPEISAAGVEPGSGSTIMGYAGITADETTNAPYDVQTHSDPYFAWRSINQIQVNLNPKTCPVTTVMTNNVPVVNAGLDYTIPVSTPFVLEGTATDADVDDVLNYIWEENDLGNSTTTRTESFVKSTKTVGPTFRIFKPSSNKFRYFPQMGKILGGIISITTGSTSNWETVSSVARTLNFGFTARDNHPGGGQTASDFTKITVDATGGPFTVTSQATTNLSYPSNSDQTVTWNVANTTAAPFNTATVDILITTNASTAFETFNATTPTSPNPTTWTTIATGVPNNGSAIVTLPSLPVLKNTCRFMVKANGNVFLAVNSKNFTIQKDLANTSFDFSNFSLYPNPSKGNFNIQFDSSTSNDIKILVHDLRGRNVFENNYNNTGTFNQNISLDYVQKGMYLVTVQDGERRIVKKILIE